MLDISSLEKFYSCFAIVSFCCKELSQEFKFLLVYWWIVLENNWSIWDNERSLFHFTPFRYHKLVYLCYMWDLLWMLKYILRSRSLELWSLRWICLFPFFFGCWKTHALVRRLSFGGSEFTIVPLYCFCWFFCLPFGHVERFFVHYFIWFCTITQR